MDKREGGHMAHEIESLKALLWAASKTYGKLMVFDENIAAYYEGNNDLDIKTNSRGKFVTIEAVEFKNKEPADQLPAGIGGG